MAKWNKLAPDCGCGCDGGCAPICFTIVTSCSGHPVIAGATVTLSQGATTTATGTTDSGGHVCLSYGVAGSYTLTVAVSGYTTATQTVSLACTGINQSVTLTPTGTLPCCSCPNPPGTLYMSDSGPCDTGIFQPATLVYGAKPSEFSSISALPANGYYSTETFTDSFTGIDFRYLFACDGNFYHLTRIYEPTPYGAAFWDTASIYTWTYPFTGNTCSPFHLSNGSIFSGGNGACIVTISE